MPDDQDPKPEDLKPQNVQEKTAEAYLLATGWVQSTQGGKWLAPMSRVAFSRGQAVVRQFQEDFVRLAFVMQHLPPEFLLMLVPPVIIEQIKETVEKAFAEHLAKSTETKGPAN